MIWGSWRDAPELTDPFAISSILASCGSTVLSAPEGAEHPLPKAARTKLIPAAINFIYFLRIIYLPG
jgi:hypothetical protein